MTTDQMDADLERCTEPKGMSERLGYWERRLRVSQPSASDIARIGEIATKHALRIAAAMRVGQ